MLTPKGAINIEGSGKFCWETEYGCSVQKKVFGTIGVLILAFLIFGIVYEWIGNRLDK